MSGGGGNTNTVTKSDPWGPQQDYLRQIFAEAQKQFASPGPLYYGSGAAPVAPNAPGREGFTTVATPGTAGRPSLDPRQPTTAGTPGTPGSFNQVGFDAATAKYQQDLQKYNTDLAAWQSAPKTSTIAPVQAETVAGQQQVTNFATGQGQQNVNATSQALQFNLNDAKYVDSNPYLQQAIQAAINPMVRNATSVGGSIYNTGDEALSAGQWGGTRHGVSEGIARTNLQQQIGDVSSRMASDAYTSGLDTSSRALALAPGVQQMGTSPGQMLDAVGQQKQAYEQQAIQESIDRWNFSQNLPGAKLAQFQGAVTGGFGGESSTQVPIARKNPIMGMAGGAMSGAAMGSAIPGMGTAWGAGIGAIIGLMGSM